jgi:hypothetical protein
MRAIKTTRKTVRGGYNALHRMDCFYWEDGYESSCDCGMREVVEALASDDPLGEIMALLDRVQEEV